MEKIDIVIIGAGVVGLSIAEKLASQKREIVVLEQHGSFGQEASSRNSEVLHAGIYYPTFSLKARLCVDGNIRLYEICDKNQIPFKKIGKLIISNSKVETEKIHNLYTLGKENGVEGLSLLDKSHIKDVEPAIKADFAVYSRETGIIDSHRLMKYYETGAEEKGVIFSYNSRVVSIENANDWYYISVRESDNHITKLQSKYVINCAGLHSDEIARMVGIDIQQHKYQIYPCKGEYFSVSNKYKSKVKHLIYPAPTDISLGIHTVIDLNENLKLGPNAFYINKIDYNVNPAHSLEIYRSAKSYLPFLKEEDISPSMSGIRAKIQKSGDIFRDFIIREEKDKKLPGFINLIGIESPGLTSSPAIAEYISHIVDNS